MDAVIVFYLVSFTYYLLFLRFFFVLFSAEKSKISKIRFQFMFGRPLVLTQTGTVSHCT